jgi:hypothetical protein
MLLARQVFTLPAKDTNGMANYLLSILLNLLKRKRQSNEDK